MLLPMLNAHYHFENMLSMFPTKTCFRVAYKKDVLCFRRPLLKMSKVSYLVLSRLHNSISLARSFIKTITNNSICAYLRVSFTTDGFSRNSLLLSIIREETCSKYFDSSSQDVAAAT